MLFGPPSLTLPPIVTDAVKAATVPYTRNSGFVYGFFGGASGVSEAFDSIERVCGPAYGMALPGSTPRGRLGREGSRIHDELGDRILSREQSWLAAVLAFGERPRPEVLLTDEMRG